MDRREFLKTVGVAAGAAMIGKPLRAGEKETHSDELMGILVDTTRCVGCRTCEFTCAEVNGLPEPSDDDEAMFAQERSPSETQWTVVNRYETDVGEVFVKKQCMHCNEPACAAACPTRAMYKTPRGPVIWRADKCMGCRFCMISCPFDMPKFEYHSAVPKIQKCRMCFERLQEGEEPACVEECPEDALLFGTRRELLEIARERIYHHPDRYVHYIYGEHEAGGTGYLYLAAVPFEQLGFKTNVAMKPYPEFTREFLYAVPVVLTLLPAFLLAVSKATHQEGTEQMENEE